MPSSFTSVASQSLYIPISYIPTTSVYSFPRTQTSSYIPPQITAYRISPLSLPAQLHHLPQNYSQRIVTHSGEGDILAQQHLDRFNDFIDLEEVDHEDVKLRLFAQGLSSELKKWFRTLPAGSINTFQQFE